jgi:mediator of RNA polymerase II transcription subunit 17
MLSHAHRNNELMRTRPLPPHISRTRSPQHTYTLLRPILAQISHIRSTHECTKYVGAIVQTLKNAGLPASFTLSTAKPSLASPGGTGPNKPSDAQLLVHNFTQPIDFSIDLTVVEDMSFTIRGRTLLYPFMGKNFHIVLPPSSPLENICPPYKEGYPDFAALRSTLCVTVSKIITEHFLSKLSGGPWIRSIKGMSICDSETEDSELQLSVTEDDERKPLLDVTCTKIEDGRRLIKKWTWRGEDASQTVTLGSLVDQFTSRTLDLSDP